MSFHMDAQIVPIDELDFDFKYKLLSLFYIVLALYFVQIMYQKIYKNQLLCN